jgi:hypothetical protein
LVANYFPHPNIDFAIVDGLEWWMDTAHFSIVLRMRFVFRSKAHHITALLSKAAAPKPVIRTVANGPKDHFVGAKKTNQPNASSGKCVA